MKKFMLTVCAAGLACALAAGNAVNPNAIELRPIPLPKDMTSAIDTPVAFDAQTTVTVACGDAAAAPWLARHYRAWYGSQAPQVKPAPANDAALRAGDEAYAIVADAQGVTITARTLKGVRWAAYTLRPLAIAKRGTAQTAGRILPTLKISDAPNLAFRGIHFCWFPETRPQQIERAIRLAAQMKFNYAVIEPWAQYRSAKHPWWGWPDGTLTKAEARRLAAVGRDLGITLIPQINAYGHATSSRSCSLKHAILDIDPSHEPLFEPGGWNWCISNPETQRVLRELIAEMHEDFGNPPFFHLGGDEAQPPSCPECRKTPYADQVARHFAGLSAFLKTRGARAMMWHDQMLWRGDPRWRGFVATGDKDFAAQLIKKMPRDILICDWQYSYGRMNEKRSDWPTFAYFKSQGFDVVGSPWRNYEAMRPMADYLNKNRCFGVLETTWHTLRGDDWRKMYIYASAAAWGSAIPSSSPQFNTNLALTWRIPGHDMKITDRRDSGDAEYQVLPFIHR